MIMWRIVLIVLAVCLFAACAKTPVKQNFYIPDVTNIAIKNTPQVTVTAQHQPTNSIGIHGKNVSYRYDGHVLTLSSSCPLTVKLPYNQPHNLLLENDGQVKVQNTLTFHRLIIEDVRHASLNSLVKVRQLALKNTSVSTMRLYNLYKLYLSTNANVNLKGILSHKLYVFANDNALASLSGKVKRLIVTVSNHAKVNTENLAANKVYVKAYDESFARVHAINVIFISTMHTADVFYTGEPKVYRNSLNGSAALQLEPFAWP